MAHVGALADLETIRSWFPVTKEKIYLYNGNVHPCAAPVRAAVEAFLDVWSRGGDDAWPFGWVAFEEAKELFARLIGTPDMNAAISEEPVA